MRIPTITIARRDIKNSKILIKIFVFSFCGVFCCAQAFVFPASQSFFSSISDAFHAAGSTRVALSISAADAVGAYESEVVTTSENSRTNINHSEEKRERIDRENENIVGIYSSRITYILPIVQILIFASQKN